MSEAILAVDLGGTNLRMAAVSQNGSIFTRARMPTPKSATPADFLGALGSLAAECKTGLGSDKDIVGMAVAVPATFNAAKGILTKLPNLPTLNGMNLKADLSAKFGIPVTLENDATSAGIGENWLGASRGVASSIIVTLGTGVGGGIIIDHKPVRGIDGTAGEIGHICVEPLGHPCGCGSRGCIEQYASATAIVRLANENTSTSSAAGENGAWPTAADIYDAAKNGNEIARHAFRQMAFYLGIALSGLINTLNPEMIVIGGGVSAGIDLFGDDLRAEVLKRTFHEPAERAKIVRAELGDDAGILGAARAAFGEK